MTLYMTESIPSAVLGVHKNNRRPALKHHWLQDLIAGVGVNDAFNMTGRAAQWMADNRPEVDLYSTCLSVDRGVMVISFRVKEDADDDTVTTYNVRLHRSVSMVQHGYYAG